MYQEIQSVKVEALVSKKKKKKKKKKKSLCKARKGIPQKYKIIAFMSFTKQTGVVPILMNIYF
jgi:hypothetical protein